MTAILKRRGAGFTLTEMLVATSLFSVVALSSTDIFIRAQHAERVAASIEKTQDTTRFLITRMAEEIQSSRIDYAYYYDPSNAVAKDSSSTAAIISTSTLALQNNDGHYMLFAVRDATSKDFDANTTCKEPTGILCLFEQVDNAQNERVNPDGYGITALRFLITPGQDPFTIDTNTNDYLSNAQPKVTIILSVHSVTAQGAPPIDATLQTTVSTRDYPR